MRVGPVRLCSQMAMTVTTANPVAIQRRFLA